MIIKPARNEYSANVAYNSVLLLMSMARKEHKQLNINTAKQTTVISSTKVVSENLKNFKDVKTRKQKPRKLEAVFNICAGL